MHAGLRVKTTDELKVYADENHPEKPFIHVCISYNN